MKVNIKFLLGCWIMLSPLFTLSQVTTPQKDSVKVSSMDSTIGPKKDTVIVADTVVPVTKNCYAEWYDTFRARGAKPVPDGMHEVIVALKNEEGSHCFMGQVEVSGGKIKPPLFFQQENGEYRQVSIVGKKLEPGFVGSMTADELYGIKDGMSIVFRTTDQEYGRLFFYKFVNKVAQGNKAAPSPTDLIKD